MDQPDATLPAAPPAETRPTDGASGAPGDRASVARRLRGVLLLGAAVTLADQLTKALVRDRIAFGDHWPADWELIRFSHYENSGAAFGILEGAGAFLLVSSLVGIAAIIGYVFWAPAGDRRYAWGLGLVLGGATGNLVDRVRLGAVTDFIDPTHYPAFNVADSAIVIGVFGLIALTLLAPPEQA